jgi:hypothetical protein
MNGKAVLLTTNIEKDSLYDSNNERFALQNIANNFIQLIQTSYKLRI